MKQRPKQQALLSKPWKNGSNNSSTAGSEPEIVIVTAPAHSQRPGNKGSGAWPAAAHGGSGSSRVATVASTTGAAPAAPGSIQQAAQRGIAGAAGGSLAMGSALSAAVWPQIPPAALPTRNSRKSVAGVPMRVPGGGGLLAAESSSGDVAGSAAAAAAAALPGSRRRTSMMPQRVPYSSTAQQQDVSAGRAGLMAPPSAPAGAAGGGNSLGRMGDVPGDAGMAMGMVPDSPESYAHSDASGAGEGAGAVGLEHRGTGAR